MLTGMDSEGKNKPSFLGDKSPKKLLFHMHMAEIKSCLLKWKKKSYVSVRHHVQYN